MQTLGSRIKNRMREKGLSQKELARLVGMSEKGLSELINDKYEPRLNTLRLLSQHLDMPLTEIVFGESPLDYAARRFSSQQMLKIKDQKSEYRTTLEKKLEALIEKIFKLDDPNRTLVEQLIDKLLETQK